MTSDRPIGSITNRHVGVGVPVSPRADLIGPVVATRISVAVGERQHELTGGRAHERLADALMVVEPEGRELQPAEPTACEAVGIETVGVVEQRRRRDAPPATRSSGASPVAPVLADHHRRVDLADQHLALAQAEGLVHDPVGEVEAPGVPSASLSRSSQT